MFPSFAHMHPAAISVKRSRHEDADAPAVKRRSTLYDYEAIAVSRVYRGASGDGALDKCLDGGHFSWLKETAEDYADVSYGNCPGYLIETSPLCMYLGGSDFSHGGQWDAFYGSFCIDAVEQPAYWSSMLNLVTDWKKAIDRDETRSALEPLPRTKDKFMQMMYWERPTSNQKELLQRLGPLQAVLEWTSANAVCLQDWKSAAHAAILAAPWHIDQGEWTSEFYSEGADLISCIESVEKDRVVVYERTAEAGSEQARKDFREWYLTTSHS